MLVAIEKFKILSTLSDTCESAAATLPLAHYEERSERASLRPRRRTLHTDGSRSGSSGVERYPGRNAARRAAVVIFVRGTRCASWTL